MKTGDNLATGNNNLFLGSSRSLIFQKVSDSLFDLVIHIMIQVLVIGIQVF